MVFNPKDYLTSQGWQGEGKGLHSNSRSKPITVLQKKNSFGVGKDRDHSYPWWDDVFKSVIDKISVKKDETDPKENQLELRRTETGIISHLPSLPPMIDIPKSNLNLNSMNDAKRNEAIQNLYRNFRRGQIIEGNVEEVKPINQDCASSSIVPIDSGVDHGERIEMKETKRKERKERKEKKEKKVKKAKREAEELNNTTDTNDPKGVRETRDTNDQKGSNHTTDTMNRKEKKEKKEKKDRAKKKEKKEKQKLEGSDEGFKLKTIKKVIINEGLNQIFNIDSSIKNERKLKRKCSKLEKHEEDGKSSILEKKKRKKQE